MWVKRQDEKKNAEENLYKKYEEVYEFFSRQDEEHKKYEHKEEDL